MRNDKNEEILLFFTFPYSRDTNMLCLTPLYLFEQIPYLYLIKSGKTRLSNHTKHLSRVPKPSIGESWRSKFSFDKNWF